MNPVRRRSSIRRRPQQLRARQTVEAVLDAVIRILKREGFDAITTNRVAEVAGVSIGSVYQYFPDKRSIFVALHSRHVSTIERMVETKLVEHAASSPDQLVRAMVEAMVDAHASDPELHELLMAEVPHRADGTRDFAVRLHGVFRLAIQSGWRERKDARDLDTVVFMVTKMVEALSHAAVLERPQSRVAYGCEGRNSQSGVSLPGGAATRTQPLPSEVRSASDMCCAGLMYYDNLSFALGNSHIDVTNEAHRSG